MNVCMDIAKSPSPSLAKELRGLRVREEGKGGTEGCFSAGFSGKEGEWERVWWQTLRNHFD